MTARPSVRAPAVAGTFYPADPPRLRRALDEAFADSVASESVTSGDVPRPQGIVVPHAGYVYSGAVAASAYRRIAAVRDTIDRVVLLGPCHRVYVRGIAVPGVDAFDTPLGRIPIDDDARAAVLELPAVQIDDRAHTREHSLEVQLPFLQTVLREFSLLPLAVGDASVSEVAAALDGFWGAPGTLVVISTDLSHYHAYDDAVALDERTAAAIVSRRPDAIRDRDACGARPLRGALRIATERELSVEQLDLRNSGDTAGDRERVVGYGAFAIG